MGSVNKVILVGNLGRDAELRYTPGGAAVATLNLATTEVWNDKAGQKQEKTEWHRIVLWGKTAESLNEYLTKGKQIYVEGRLQTRSGTTRTATSATRPRSAATGSCCSAAGAVAAVVHASRIAARRAGAAPGADDHDGRAGQRADGRRYSVLTNGKDFRVLRVLRVLRF